MNLLKLSLSYIRQRKLNTLLNVLLLALGIATIVVVLLFSKQMEDNLTRNSRGLDAVVGAKGSPLQLILSGIYHMDAPTGNIPLKEAMKMVPNRAIKKAIPLALGDSYSGYRIVGTTPLYLEHYEAELAAGELWDHTLEIVLGAQVAREAGLAIGDEITSSHGLTAGGHAHDDHQLIVKGILKQNDTVLDRLILCSVETMWAIHEEVDEAEDHEEEHEEKHAHDHDTEKEHDHDEDHQEEQASHKGHPLIMKKTGFAYTPADSAEAITSLLIQYSSPMAAATFPRFINARTNMQAASPAFETARLFNLLGVGYDAVQALGILLIITAALSVFIALYTAMKARRYDLAIMRTLGASPGKLLWHVILEGVLLAFLGTAAGLALGHLASDLLGQWLRDAQQLSISGGVFLNEEFWLIGLAIVVGIISAVIPAIQAYRTDISGTLAEK